MFGRKPDSEESTIAIDFLSNAHSTFESKGVEDQQLDIESWQSLVRSLIRTNEFVYLD